MPVAAFKGPLPASIMVKLTFKQRLMARWWDSQAKIEASLPHTFREAASCLARRS